MSVCANLIPTKTESASRSVSAASGECEWRLPSGEDLIAFALAVGFTAGPLAEPILSAKGPERRSAGLTPHHNR